MDPCKELDAMLKEAGMKVVIGLKAQGHIPTIERMLAEGWNWDAIGEVIGWHGPSAREHYALYQLGERIRTEEGARIRRELEAGFNELDVIPTGTARIYSRGELQALLNRVVRETSASCAWTEDEDGVWTSACGESYVFTDGGPAENRARFCPYCGRPLEVKKA